MTHFLSLLLVILLLVLTTGSALAAPFLPVADVYVDHQTANQNTNYNGQELRISGSFQGGICSPTRTVFLRFNLSEVDVTIGDATLTLTTEDTGSSQAGGQEVSLFRVADDSWNEATVTYTTAPMVGVKIASTSLPNSVASGVPVQFRSTGLIDYLNEEVSGDGLVSLAVRFTTCAQTSTQRFEDKETGSSPAQLEIFATNAVTLSTFSTDTTAPTWLFYVVLGVLALIVVAGVALSRRWAALR